MTGWACVPGSPVQVVPLGDLREHVESGACWCRPVSEVDGAVIVHRALDRRELYERGDLRPC